MWRRLAYIPTSMRCASAASSPKAGRSACRIIRSLIIPPSFSSFEGAIQKALAIGQILIKSDVASSRPTLRPPAAARDYLKAFYDHAPALDVGARGALRRNDSL